MCLKEKNLLQKFAATLKEFSAQGAKKVEYGMSFWHVIYIIPRMEIDFSVSFLILVCLEYRQDLTTY